MKKFKNYLITLFVSLILHLVLVRFQILPGDIRYAILIEICIGFIFLIPIALLFPIVNNYSSEKFSLKFLTITSVQFLLILALLLGLKMIVQEQLKYWLFTTVILFVFELINMSLMFLKFIKNRT